MPILYIIAGPPGVGKSTYGRDFVPYPVNVLNHDQIEFGYKEANVPNYQQLANQEMWRLIYESISQDIDFGIELNLGTDDQYGLLRKTHSFCPHYDIHVILLYTSLSQLCLLRASSRADEGGHYVEPAMIDHMYWQTLNLLKQNSSMISYLTLIDVTYNSIELVYAGSYPNHHDYINHTLPMWVMKNFPKIQIS